MARPDDPTLLLIQALSAIWRTIRLLHPDVPSVVLIPAPAAKKNVLGHFAPLRWRPNVATSEVTTLHEVVVVAEHLNRGAEEILETLLHEAAHALNFERGIKDCTASQYHNARFKGAAEEMGLTVCQVRHYGYAVTALAEGTVEDYHDEVERLREVLVHRVTWKAPTTGPSTTGDDDTRDPDTTTTGGRSKNRYLKAVCGCEPPFVIRVARGTLAGTVIRCESCGHEFSCH